MGVGGPAEVVLVVVGAFEVVEVVGEAMVGGGAAEVVLVMGGVVNDGFAVEVLLLAKPTPESWTAGTRLDLK